MICKTKPIVKYRKDYKMPNYLIDKIDLYVDLYEDKAIVTAKSLVRKNPDAENISQLVLNGEEQVLKYIKIDGKELAPDQYKLDKETLTLKNVPDKFDLEIQTEIKPQENTSLMGLYKTKVMFCTQCEPEGFRKITYFIDRPDVLAKYTTTITADKKLYPILLSNGNLIESENLDNGRHLVKWEDPFKKPSYLFALVAGDLEYIEDYFITMSDRKITLRIFSEEGNKEKCRFAMESIKKSMKWDEENYGREYDLDLFMIVAINDFNAGAMENKGLNIFNSKYIFVNSKTATDEDYRVVDSVVAHEYFHNWTGDRVTCRDWFQLSLKEGLTVFRDQTFSEDVFSSAVDRIDCVQCMRTVQFSEDQSPLAHPVRPDSYIEMENFYTSTVYNKGAEVIRMMQTILGKDNFRKGMDVYFDRFDGQAVTCDDFAASMEEAGNIDLTQFKLWYSQAGTPELYVSSKYDPDKKQYTLSVKQDIPKTPGQDKKLPMHIPLHIGLLGSDGKEMPLKLSDSGSKDFVDSLVLNVVKSEQDFIFENISEKPIPSLLRDFSAPVKLFYDYTDKELAFLMVNDRDAFARFDAGQKYMERIAFDFIEKRKREENLELPEEFILAFKNILLDEKDDKALISQLLTMPREGYLADQMKEVDVDVDSIHEVREFMKKTLVEKLKPEFEKVYRDNLIDGGYRFEVLDVAKRSLKNACLSYLVKLDDEKYCKLAFEQFKSSNNMTDQYAALSILNNSKCKERHEVLELFYNQWKNEPLVVDKWFRVQAMSFLPGVAKEVGGLLKHPDFNIKNPNKVYALIAAFALFNPVGFHNKTGAGYYLVADKVLELNKLNPQVAARVAQAFAKWKRYDKNRQSLMKEQLERILKEPELSKNVYEIVSKSLEG